MTRQTLPMKESLVETPSTLAEILNSLLEDLTSCVPLITSDMYFMPEVHDLLQKVVRIDI